MGPNRALSILLPFRNAAPTLEDAVGSIAAQSLADWELLLIDNASTDEESGDRGALGAARSAHPFVA
jgi:hypothetical protein